MSAAERLVADVAGLKVLFVMAAEPEYGARLRETIVPLMTEHRYYQFTPRGIYEVDKSNGQVVHLFRGADRDSGGGAILTTPELLITISPHAITAYPLKTASEVAAR